MGKSANVGKHKTAGAPEHAKGQQNTYIGNVKTDTVTAKTFKEAPDAAPTGAVAGAELTPEQLAAAKKVKMDRKFKEWSERKEELDRKYAEKKEKNKAKKAEKAKNPELSLGGACKSCGNKGAQTRCQTCNAAVHAGDRCCPKKKCCKCAGVKLAEKKVPVVVEKKPLQKGMTAPCGKCGKTDHWPKPCAPNAQKKKFQRQ